MGRALIPLWVTGLSATAWAVRPTDGDGWYGNGYESGAAVASFPSPDGQFRVHYVTESVDAVPPEDGDADGVPDFVELVADSADAVWRSAVVERGFRPPLDDSVYHDSDDFGGDSRYDIYLMNIEDSDGYLVSEVCLLRPSWCAGYFAMENDFVGFGYPSREVAVRVLTSHEFFHALQNAYDNDQDRSWAEGTAVWNEEAVFPEQDDYEHLIGYFLAKPERPFDRASSGSFSDFYPYGAALWATYLEERFGTGTVRSTWEACENTDGSDPDFLEATSAVLTAMGSSLAEAWMEFTQWNLMTGERADPNRAYTNGALWPSVRLEEPQVGYPMDVTVKSEGMSARYLPISLSDRQGQAARVSVSAVQGPAVLASAFLWDGQALGDAISLAPHADVTWSGEKTLFVVVTGVTRGALSRDVRITLADPPEPEEPPIVEPMPDDDGCTCAAPGRRAGRGAAFILLGAFGAMLLARRATCCGR